MKTGSYVTQNPLPKKTEDTAMFTEKCKARGSLHTIKGHGEEWPIVPTRTRSLVRLIEFSCDPSSFPTPSTFSSQAGCCHYDDAPVGGIWPVDSLWGVRYRDEQSQSNWWTLENRLRVSSAFQQKMVANSLRHYTSSPGMSFFLEFPRSNRELQDWATLTPRMVTYVTATAGICRLKSTRA